MRIENIGFRNTWKYHDFVLLALLIFSYAAFSQNEWKLAKEKNGIKVYVRDAGTNGLKELRCTTEFKNVSLHNIIAVFKDVENSGQWTKELKRSVTLKTISDFESMEYYEIKAPWPIKNRDLIYNVKIHQDTKDKSIHIQAKSIPNYIPKKESIVRVIHSHGFWKFTPKPGGAIDVQYQLYADPVGFPAWLVNMLATDSPVDVVLSLKEFLKKPEYHNLKFSFIKE